MRGAEHSVAPPCATAVHRKGSKGLLLAGSGVLAGTGVPPVGGGWHGGCGLKAWVVVQG